MRATEGTVTIACKHALDRVEGRADVDKIVSVRCLGRVEESLLIMLASLGAKRIVLVSDACEGCQFNNGRKVAQSVCDTATTLLRAWNNDARISITPKFPTLCKLPGGQDHDVGKRNFFLDVGKNVKDATNTTVGYTLEKTLDLPQPEQVHYVPVMEDGTMPHFIPSRRRHIIEALQSLGTPSEEFLETRLWGHVVIDTDACNSCRMCATFCPTGAITKFDEEDGTCGIEHHPQDCVQCRCCTEICNEGALTVSKEVSAADIVLGGFDRYEMSQLTYQPGQLKSIHERVRSLTGVEEVYDH
ncbi:MAG: 4Fe-4S binding protein [Coriobacteriaceae bacterium]|nr:4Fe-4S binding protein [Coriobacteriaceae bacterium]